jgi:predicted Zn-dependent protease
MARASGDQPLEFLSTHPSHQSRFEELQAEMPEALALYQAEQEQDRIPECG